MIGETEAVDSGKTVVRTGTIAGIAWSAELKDNLIKEPKESAHITRLGIPGDRHYGETRYSNSRRKRVPNDRPVTVFGAESTRAVCDKLDIAPVGPGGMGENLLFEGLGDLSDAVAGDEIHILGQDGAPKVVLLVTEQNLPCSNLKVYHKQMTKEMMGRRGLVCTVLQEGEAHVDDRVALVR